MTVREKISAIKNVQEYRDEIKEILRRISHDTYDWTIDDVYSFYVRDSDIDVDYYYTCRGEHGGENAIIPIAWLDEGFDYGEAYREMLREAERKEKEAEARRKQKEKKKTEEREYKTYLRLKEKFGENQGERQ